MFICRCREKNGGFFDLLALSFLNFHFWSKPKIPEHDIPSATIFALLASKWKLINNCWEMTNNSTFSFIHKKELKKN